LESCPFKVSFINKFHLVGNQIGNLSIAAEKVPEKTGGSCSIDKWFSSDRDTKSFKKSTDFTAKPEAAKISGGQSGGIWGDFDCDSIPDAVLLTAADAVERHEIKTERSQPDGDLHFPGRGQKLVEVTNTTVPVGSIVRRIPGVGVISGRSQPRESPSIKPAVNAAAANLSQCRSFPNMSSFAVLTPKSDNVIGGRRASFAAPVKFESVDDFRKTVGMVLSPPGTEVHIKNFVSVCNRNARPLPNRNNASLDAPVLKAVRSLSDDETRMAVRPPKKMRTDVEGTPLNVTASSDSKKFATMPQPSDMALDTGDDDGVIMVQSDSENSGAEDSEQNVELNADNNMPSTLNDILPSGASVDGAATSTVDEAAGGVGRSQTGCVECPVCCVAVPVNIINEHLDQCLS